MTHGHIPFNMLISTMYYSNMLMRLCEKTDFVTPFLSRQGWGGGLNGPGGIGVQRPPLKFLFPVKDNKVCLFVFELLTEKCFVLGAYFLGQELLCCKVLTML